MKNITTDLVAINAFSKLKKNNRFNLICETQSIKLLFKMLTADQKSNLLLWPKDGLQLCLNRVYSKFISVHLLLLF